VTLKRWAQHPQFLSADLTICLVAENLSELNAGLVQNPASRLFPSRCRMKRTAGIHSSCRTGAGAG